MTSHAHPDVQAAADLAVEKVFWLLGVNVKDAKDVERFRQDLRFGADIRRYVNHGLTATVVAFIVAVATAAWAGIRQALIHGK